MADNVDVTPGSGKTIATDERSVGGSTVHIQRSVQVGGSGGSSGQVTVTNTSTTIKAATDTRLYIVIINRQSVPIYIDPAGGTATTSNGRLDPGETLTLWTTSAVTAVTTNAYTASAEDKAHYFEVSS